MRALPKPRPRALDKRAIALTKAKQYADARVIVLKRDGQRCRICGKPARDCHHIVFKSLGGKDEPRNLIAVCRGCHADIHQHIVKVSGSSSHLRVTRWSEEAHTWVS